MAVLHDFECAAHGIFESYDGLCPYGCKRNLSRLIFTKAPGTRSARTAFQDRETRAMAESFGLTNFHSSHDGESVMDSTRRRQVQSTDRAFWGEVPHARPGWSWTPGHAAAPKLDLAPLSRNPVQPGFAPERMPVPTPQPVFGGRPVK